MTPALEQAARDLLAVYPRPAGALLPLLEAVLRARGGCDEATCDWVAARLQLPPALVRGIASTRVPPAPATEPGAHDDGAHDDGAHDDGEGAAVVDEASGDSADVVQVCTGLGCRWMGAEAVLEQLRAAGLRVVTVDCLGTCSAAPVMARGGRLHDGLTPERLADLIAADRQGP